MSAAALADMILRHQPCVVLTGAGMSTESGIPDFRSATGMWADVDPFEVASIEAFRSDPERVWRWYGQRIHGLLSAEPNPGHYALAALEQAGLVQAVVTQNIDTLHTRAGSVDVIEVHGSIRSFDCLACGASETLEGILHQLDVREAPVCAGCETIVKPGVVMFGELLPAAAMERAERLVRTAGLLLVVGSSLQVWPVGSLPGDALASGAKLAILNREETPYDRDAAVVVGAAAGETLDAVRRALVDGAPG